MARMFRVFGFWTLAIALMAMAGDMVTMAILFFIQAVVFTFLGYMKFTEKAYILTFWAYMIVAFMGFTYYTVFEMPLPF